MLTEILSVPLPEPKPASSHILNQPIVGIGSPAGDSGSGDLSAAGDNAQVARRSDSLPAGSEAWMSARLDEAVELGEVVKLTGARSITSSGGEAA